MDAPTARFYIGTGNMAAGTSTGGEDHNSPGRVGDSALVGCGFYADNQLGACAVSGTGEAIMQVVLAKTAVEVLASGVTPDAAAALAIELLGERVQGEGGLIMLDTQGQLGWAHNSAAMPIAYWCEGMDAPVYVVTKEHATAR